jgi:hypothetical protein
MKNASSFNFELYRKSLLDGFDDFIDELGEKNSLLTRIERENKLSFLNTWYEEIESSIHLIYDYLHDYCHCNLILGG